MDLAPHGVGNVAAMVSITQDLPSFLKSNLIDFFADFTDQKSRPVNYYSPDTFRVGASKIQGFSVEKPYL